MRTWPRSPPRGSPRPAHVAQGLHDDGAKRSAGGQRESGQERLDHRALPQGSRQARRQRSVLKALAGQAAAGQQHVALAGAVCLGHPRVQQAPQLGRGWDGSRLRPAKAGVA